MQQGEKCVFSLCRPPGHHASRDMAGGYCYMNNAAIAVANGIKKIMYMDFTSLGTAGSDHNNVNFEKLMQFAAPYVPRECGCLHSNTKMKEVIWYVWCNLYYNGYTELPREEFTATSTPTPTRPTTGTSKQTNPATTTTPPRTSTTTSTKPQQHAHQDHTQHQPHEHCR